MRKEIIIPAKKFSNIVSVPLVADDVNAYELVYHAPQDLSGAAFVVTAIRADGEKITDSGEISGRTARYRMKNSMHAVEGELVVRVTIMDTDETALTTNELLFTVIPGNGSGNPEADTQYPVLTALVIDAQRAINSADSAAALANEKAQAAQTAAETAGESAELAEVKAAYAQAAAAGAAQAKIKAEASAEAANQKVEAMNACLQESTEVLAAFKEQKKYTLPIGTNADAGKVMTLQKSELHFEMQTFSKQFLPPYDTSAAVFGVGKVGDTAYLDMGASAFQALNIPNPVDVKCVFGFTFVPDSTDLSADYDIVVLETEKLSNGYRVWFPGEQCSLFGSSITTPAQLNSAFEYIQFQGEFPVYYPAPEWTSLENAITSEFIDECILSAAHSYTDTKCAGKVDKVTGKGLSQNDFTNALKAKVEGIDSLVTEKTSESLESAKTYADTKDAAALQSAKNYTDSAIGRERALLDNQPKITRTGEVLSGSDSIGVMEKFVISGGFNPSGEPSLDSPATVSFTEDLNFCGNTLDISELALKGASANNQEAYDQIVVDYRNKTVKHIQRYKKFTFSASSGLSVTALSATASVNRWTTSIGSVYPAPESSRIGFCNILPFGNGFTDAESVNYPCIMANNVTAYFKLPVSYGTDAAAVKQMLIDKGFYFWYVLATPIETDITDTELGQALLNLTLPKEFSVQTTGTSGKHEITYVRDLNAVISELQNAIISLGGEI